MIVKLRRKMFSIGTELKKKTFMLGDELYNKNQSEKKVEKLFFFRMNHVRLFIVSCWADFPTFFNHQIFYQRSSVSNWFHCNKKAFSLTLHSSNNVKELKKKYIIHAQLKNPSWFNWKLLSFVTTLSRICVI